MRVAGGPCGLDSFRTSSTSSRMEREKKPQKDLIFLNGREIIIISDKSKKEIVALNFFFFSGRPQNDSFVIQSQRLRVQRRVSLSATIQMKESKKIKRVGNVNIQINRGTRAPTRKIWKSVAIGKKVFRLLEKTRYGRKNGSTYGSGLW